MAANPLADHQGAARDLARPQEPFHPPGAAGHRAGDLRVRRHPGSQERQHRRAEPGYRNLRARPRRTLRGLAQLSVRAAPRCRCPTSPRRSTRAACSWSCASARTFRACSPRTSRPLCSSSWTAAARTLRRSSPATPRRSSTATTPSSPRPGRRPRRPAPCRSRLVQPEPGCPLEHGPQPAGDPGRARRPDGDRPVRGARARARHVRATAGIALVARARSSSARRSRPC